MTGCRATAGVSGREDNHFSRSRISLLSVRPRFTLDVTLLGLSGEKRTLNLEDGWKVLWCCLAKAFVGSWIGSWVDLSWVSSCCSSISEGFLA